ncbi:MAG: S1C family serine protease [Patescibacteria group bacterium]
MKNKQKVIFLILVIFLGGLSGVMANQYVFPYLSSSDFWSRYEFLKRGTEGVTVINKTEQIFVKEENTVNKVTSQVSASLVEIISLRKNPAEKVFSKNKSVIPSSQEAVGVIATSDGLIITDKNNLILEGASYKVILFDGSVFEAELFGTDEYSNLAFLKINASNLTVASFANSDDIKPGEKVIAFGKNPGQGIASFGSGLLSYFDETYSINGKTVSSSEKLEGVYKLDIALGGNYVGGVAADFAGQIIGIVGRVEKDGQGDFFVIPANEVKKVIEKSIKKELAQSAILGIYYIPLTKNYALIHDMKQDKGAYVYSPSLQSGLAILSGSPAEKAGLKLGDIITRVNDKEIDWENPLSEILYQKKKGEKMELTLLRNNEEIKIEVEL